MGPGCAPQQSRRCCAGRNREVSIGNVAEAGQEEGRAKSKVGVGECSKRVPSGHARQAPVPHGPGFRVGDNMDVGSRLAAPREGAGPEGAGARGRLRLA